MQALAALVESLRRWGVLRSDAVAQALEAVDLDRAFPDFPGRKGALHAPQRRSDGSFDLSPRMAVLLAELLELGEGLRVALPMPRPALLESIVRAFGARVYDPLRDSAADRVVEIGPVSRSVPLAPGGFALEARFEPHDESLSKRVQAEAAARLGLEKLALHPGQLPPRPIRHLLVVEGFMRRALDGRPRTRQDEAFLEGVAEVWNPAGGGDRERLAWARRWFTLAYIHQFSADLLDAEALYRASLDACPTAEAHTFRGWVLATLGDRRGAIEACKKAIETDPGFGNPHNDLGAYLVDDGDPAAAIPHLERALASDRYASPHFAYCNLGRAYLALGRTAEARRAFRRSLDLEPGYAPARRLLEQMG